MQTLDESEKPRFLRESKTAKPPKSLFSSIERKINTISLDEGLGFTQQIEKIFKGHRIDEGSNEVAEIFFQNELFRKLLKDLNSILDLKINKKSSLFKKPPEVKSAKLHPNKSLNLSMEFENYSHIISRQRKECMKLEAQLLKVKKSGYFESLIEEIEGNKKEIEKFKKEKRNQLDSTKINGKALEEIVEIKGLPENLQKSSIIDSDLLILNMKNKSLKKKIAKFDEENEAFIVKNDKIDFELQMVLKEATELRVSIDKKPFKAKFEELTAKIIRFKNCLDGVKTNNRRVVKKVENEIAEIKGEIEEKDNLIKKQIANLQGIREKLLSLTNNENVDKSLKTVLELFTNSFNSNNKTENSIPSTGKSKKEGNDEVLENIEEKTKIEEKNEEFKEKKEIFQDKNEFFEEKNEENEKKIKENVKKKEEESMEINQKKEHFEKKIKKPKEIIEKSESLEKKAQKNNETPLKLEKNMDFPNKEEKNEIIEEMVIEDFKPEDIKDNDLNDLLGENLENPIENQKKVSESTKQLKKLDENGIGILTISPMLFRANNEENKKKMLFCRVKIGNRAFNTKISEEKKPSWDESIEIRRNFNENSILLQVWNFDPKESEKLIGETTIDLISKEIDIDIKKIVNLDIAIYNNGMKKGDLTMEMKWMEDDL